MESIENVDQLFEHNRAAIRAIQGSRAIPEEYKTIQEAKLRALAENGWKVNFGWGYSRQMPTGNPARLPQWCDHRYTLTNSEKRKVYVAEPYHINNEYLSDISQVAEREGWKVFVRPWWSIWYPTYTIAIWFERVTK